MTAPSRKHHHKCTTFDTIDCATTDRVTFVSATTVCVTLARVTATTSPPTDLLRLRHHHHLVTDREPRPRSHRPGHQNRFSYPSHRDGGTTTASRLTASPPTTSPPTASPPPADLYPPTAYPPTASRRLRHEDRVTTTASPRQRHHAVSPQPRHNDRVATDRVAFDRVITECASPTVPPPTMSAPTALRPDHLLLVQYLDSDTTAASPPSASPPIA